MRFSRGDGAEVVERFKEGSAEVVQRCRGAAEVLQRLQGCRGAGAEVK